MNVHFQFLEKKNFKEKFFPEFPIKILFYINQKIIFMKMKSKNQV